MTNLIPRLIQDRYRAESITDTFDGAAFFLDLSGFTSMTDALMRHGTAGAEILSQLINKVFGEVITQIYKRHGYIATFAGDAVTAIFPGDDPLPACHAAAEIQSWFKEHGVLENKFGSFRIQARIGLGFGTCDWGTLGDDKAHTYYMRGYAVDAAIASEARSAKGDIVLDPALHRMLRPGSFRTEPLEHGYGKLLSLTAETPPGEPDSAYISDTIARAFFPDAVIDQHVIGEFRNVAPVFINLRQIDRHAELQRSVTTILNLAVEYGGYFNLLDFGDKGGVILVIFGAPTAHERDLLRAAEFSLDVKQALGDSIRIGLSYGETYAGIMGNEHRGTYTCLGNMVNLAARLMSLAAWGDIFTSQSVSKQIANRVACSHQGERPIKGFDQPFPVCSIDARASAEEVSYRTAMVGREAEQAILRQSLDQLKEGKNAGLVTVYAQAGMGKSRLLSDALETASSFAATLTMEVDGILRKGLNPFTQLLSTFFEIPGGDLAMRREHWRRRYADWLDKLRQIDHPRIESTVQELERVESVLAARLGIGWENSLFDQLDPQGRTENTMIALREFLRVHTFEKPLVVALEDLHWLDQFSRETFEYILPALVDESLLLIATSRYADDGSLPTLNLDETISQQKIELKALTESQMTSLVGSLLGEQPSPALLARLIQQTEGNPYYLEQYSLYLRTQDLLESTPAGLDQKQNASGIPSSINGLLVSRIDRLPIELKEFTQVAAVNGRTFNTRVLEPLVDGPTLTTMVGKGESEQLWHAEREAEFSFQHALLRDAAYEMQLNDQRQRRHRQIAEQMVRLFEGDESRTPDIAFHFYQAADYAQAKIYLSQALRYAKSNSNHEKAVEYADQLVLLTEGEERLNMILEKADTLNIQGKYDQSVDVLLEARAEAAESHLPKMEARLASRLGDALQHLGRYDEAVTALDSAMALSEDLMDSEGQAEAATFLGRTLWSMGQHKDALEPLKLAENLKRDLGDRFGKALAMYYRGVVHRDLAQYEQAMSLYEDSFQLFSEIGNKRFEIYPLYDIAVLANYRGDIETAERYFIQSEQICAEVGYKSGQSAALLNLGLIAANRGDLDLGLEKMNESLRLAKEIGETMAVAYTLFSFAQVYDQDDQLDEALNYLDESFRLMQSIGTKGYYGYIYSFMTSAWAKKGNAEKALDIGRTGVRHLKDQGNDVLHGQLHLGIAMALAELPESLTPTLERLLADIASISGLEPEPEAFFDKAVDEARHHNFVATLVPALCRSGAFHFVNASNDSQKDHALALMREARDLSLKFGMVAEERRIQNFAEQQGISLDNAN